MRRDPRTRGDEHLGLEHHCRVQTPHVSGSDPNLLTHLGASAAHVASKESTRSGQRWRRCWQRPQVADEAMIALLVICDHSCVRVWSARGFSVVLARQVGVGVQASL